MIKKARLISLALVLVFASSLAQVSFAATKNFALKFDAKQDSGDKGTRVIVNHSEELNLAEKLTIEAWIYATALDKSLNMITAKADTWMHAIKQEGSVYQGAVNAAQWGWEGTGRVSLERWTHVALSFDGLTYLLHVDGKLKDEVENPGEIYTSLSDVYIGWLPQWNEAFTGLIDEVRISNIPRYPTANFPRPTTEFERDSNTVLLMHFNEGQGDEAKDSSAFEHHGFIDGATWEEVDDAPFEPLMDNLSTTWDKLKSFSFTLHLNNGLNGISLPLRPSTPLTARSFAEMIGATFIINVSDDGEFIAHTDTTPGDGFPIEGGRGYIVNTPEGGAVTFTGAPWSDSESTQTAGSLSAPAVSGTLWAFVVDGVLDSEGFQESYQITVDNFTKGHRLMAGLAEAGGRFTLGYADLSRTPVVQVGDTLRLTLTDIASGKPIGKIDHIITADDIRKAYTTFYLTFDSIAPMGTRLLQNYPNPFNPETWIPYQLASNADVSIIIYDQLGKRIRTISLGNQAAGSYLSKGRAAYWDGRNEHGELVSSGLYFYQLQAGDFTSVKPMTTLK